SRRVRRKEMSQPNNNPSPAISASPSIGADVRKAKKEKGEGGIFKSLAGKVARKFVWVFSGLIFAGVFFWGLIEIGLNGPEVKLAFLGATGKFTFDRFLLFAGILALIPPAIMYYQDSRRRDAIDNNIPHLIRDIADAGR